MLNYIWLGLILAAVGIGLWNDSMKEITDAAFDRAEFAVIKLALPLAGVMALWLGMMRLAERAGLIQLLARLLRPIMARLFPEIPHDHPAMGSMLMNMAANMLGLGNAATPMGLRAMKQLESLNKMPGTATNAMCTFLALNTCCIQFVPATAVAILAVNGSSNPTAIIGTTLFATAIAAIAGVSAAKVLEKLKWFQPIADGPASARPDASKLEEEPPVSVASKPLGKAGLVVIGFLLLLFALALWQTAFPMGATMPPGFFKGFMVPVIDAVSRLMIPFLLAFLPLIAFLRGVKIYDEFVEGAKEGFQVALRIIPYLVAILVAIGTFRAAGGIDMMSRWLGPVLDKVGFPTELLPMGIMRPLSGSGSLGILTEIVKANGADSFLSRAAATMYGSSETTFYVLAVYFGSVAIRRTRHALVAGLFGDIVGMISAIAICRMVFS